MKKSKRTILIFLGVIMLALVAGILCVGLQVAPTVNHALQISELLRPVIDAENQTMHITTFAEFNGRALATENDVYLVTEDGTSYLALEQDGNAIYVSGNILFLENGKAFKLGGTMQPQVQSMDALLPQIGTLYEVLKIAAEKTEGQSVYSVTVTGDQAKTLLEAASLGEALPVEGIEKLKLQLTEKNGKLDQISFSGSGNTDETAVQLRVMLSGFRILAAGDYPIPDAVKQAAATVDPEELFSLTEDMFRLISALAPFTDMASIEGTLELAVDCGPLQLDTEMQLADLKTASHSQLDSEKLHTLPEMRGWLCMEGDISCTPKGDGYVYALKLDGAALEQLSRMILPELAQYSGNLTEGSVTILLEKKTITSMEVSIEGKIRALITNIPIMVNARFLFA